LGENTERKNTWSEGEARAGEIKKIYRRNE
jgi:hypothetical protein